MSSKLFTVELRTADDAGVMSSAEASWDDVLWVGCEERIGVCATVIRVRASR